jgi:hypothetical protein
LGNDGPAAILPGAEKTAATPGVACDALLIDQQQHRIAVAIKAELAQQLNLPGGPALSFIQASIRISPVSYCCAMAGTRPSGPNLIAASAFSI